MPIERGCDLCEAARLTRWYSEDDVCWVADCEICDVPMVVLRRHAIDPSPDEVAHMTVALARAASEHFATWTVDGHRRNIPDHWHAHARPSGTAALKWWARRFGGSR